MPGGRPGRAYPPPFPGGAAAMVARPALLDSAYRGRLTLWISQRSSVLFSPGAR